MLTRSHRQRFSCTAVLSWLLYGRAGLEELTLFVTMGSKGVAEYEFLSRTNFSIGGTSYLFDYTANENSRAAYESKFVEPTLITNDACM